MEVKDLKKDKNKSVRINSDVLKILEDEGYTLQGWLDEQLDKVVNINCTVLSICNSRIEGGLNAK